MRSNFSGAGLYNSEYRNSNRGFGRGYPRSFQSSQRQPSPQPARRGDLFIEAGKLAVEYLISHGLLPSNVVSGKSQNGTLRNNYGESQAHRSSQERESTNVGGRKTRSDLDQGISRSYSRERRNGDSRTYSSDWSHENGRDGSLTEKATASQGMEVDNDKFSKDTTKDADSDVHNSQPSESASTGDEHIEVKAETGKSLAYVDSDLKMDSSVQEKELLESSDGVKTGNGEAKDGNRNHDMGKETSKDELVVLHCEEKNDTSSKDGKDPLKLCSSSETMLQSSLINESRESDFLGEENNTRHGGGDPLDSIEDNNMKLSLVIPSSNETPRSDSISISQSDHSFRDAGVQDPVYAIDQKITSEYLSLTGKTFNDEQLGRCSSEVKDRGAKRPLEDSLGEGSKKAKQWLSFAQSDGYPQLSDLSEKQSVANKAATLNIFDDSINKESFSNISLSSKSSVESTMEQGGPKQIFSSSFKICDLNLMEASDMHENHDMSSLLYSSVSGPNKDAPVDIELSMNKNCSLSSGFSDCGAVRKDIEIIDLEGTSVQEGKSLDALATNAETDVTVMESFTNHSQDANHNPDGQVGYGFMISELLDNDVPNYSSVQPDINSLNNEMGLHNGEGIFCEDDPIYMSLGEIPISLLRNWEQPTTQGRNPFEL